MNSEDEEAQVLHTVGEPPTTAQPEQTATAVTGSSPTTDALAAGRNPWINNTLMVGPCQQANGEAEWEDFRPVSRNPNCQDSQATTNENSDQSWAVSSASSESQTESYDDPGPTSPLAEGPNNTSWGFVTPLWRPASVPEISVAATTATTPAEPGLTIDTWTAGIGPWTTVSLPPNLYQQAGDGTEWNNFRPTTRNSSC